MLGSFVGEFLIFTSTFVGVGRSWAVAASFGVILGAAYMLWLVQRIFYGATNKLTGADDAQDLGFGEFATLTPLVVLMLVMGLAPTLWLQTVTPRFQPAIVIPLRFQPSTNDNLPDMQKTPGKIQPIPLQHGPVVLHKELKTVSYNNFQIAGPTVFEQREGQR
jgi:NADH-quinone oxidoreductase subunit M